MLLSAQRVRAAHGLSGINLYVYRHAAGAWDAADLDRLEQSAALVQQDAEIPPGGNSVTSYLDVFASEQTPTVAVARAAAMVRAGPDPVAFPAVLTAGGVVFRLGLVYGLVPSWRSEFTDLFSRLLLSVEDVGHRGP